MKKALMHSVLFSALIASSIVACTRSTKDRSLKGEAAGGKGADKPGATPAAAPGTVDATAALSGVTADTTVGFINLKNLKDDNKVKLAGSSMLILSVPSVDTAKQVSALDIVTALAGTAQTTDEVLALVNSQTDEMLKDDKLIVRDIKLTKANKAVVLQQLEDCKSRGEDIKNCNISFSYNFQSAFLGENNEIITSDDFLKNYYEISLKNNPKYKEATDKAAYLTGLDKAYIQMTYIDVNSQMTSLLGVGVKFSYISPESIDYMENTRENNIKLPNTRVVKLKFVGNLPSNLTLKPLVKSSLECSKVSSIALVGNSRETTKDRASAAKDKTFGEATEKTLMASLGTPVALDQAKTKAATHLATMDSATALNKIIVTTNDKVRGMKGGALLDASTGQYIGVFTADENGLIMGACLKQFKSLNDKINKKKASDSSWLFLIFKNLNQILFANDFQRFNDDIFSGHVVSTSSHFRDFLDDIHAFDDFSKNGVLAIKP